MNTLSMRGLNMDSRLEKAFQRCPIHKLLLLIGLGFLIGLDALVAPLSADSWTKADQPLAKIGFDQNLNARVPLDLAFRNETGDPVHLADYFGSQPVILTLVYYRCPMMCTETLNGLVRALRSLTLEPGRQFHIVTVSIDPQETSALAAAKKRVYVERYGRSGADKGWSFLTGDSEPIRRLTKTAGFNYAYDTEVKEFAHATGFLVLTPEGRISHYFYGVEYSARDLRLALVEAAGGRVGSPVDKFLLYCYHYDPLTGKYGIQIMKILRLAGAATVLLLGLRLFLWLRKEKATPEAAPGL